MVAVKMERNRTSGFRLGYVLEVKLAGNTGGLLVGKMEPVVFDPRNWMNDCAIYWGREGQRGKEA